MGFKIQNGGQPDNFPSVYYSEDFESGITNDAPDPVWGLTSYLSISPGNFFEIVSGISYTGSKCLRWSYTGRNGVGNTCGNVVRTHKTGVNGVNYFLADSGEDLTVTGDLTTPNCAVGRYVYNGTNGYSKWQITDIQSVNGTNDKLVLDLIAGPMDGISTAQFNGGDNVLLIRVCGVDGNVGSINRRSDSDQGITYFSNCAQSMRETLFRRFYFRYSSGTVWPNVTQKLLYWNTSTYSDLRSDFLPDVSGKPKFVGGGQYSSVLMEADTWYYIEEERKPETYVGASDGEYRLWIAVAGDPVGDPDIDVGGIPWGLLTACSFWGNNQHTNDLSGYCYFDNFVISNRRVGPI